ncbi:MAG TPA: hypothetical protein VIV11_38010 [Kofleriaceae bacterium]
MTLAACGSDPGQTITGRVNTGSFPEPITQVRAIGNIETIEAQVFADGSFLLTLPADDRYRIEMVAAVRSPDLVYPRSASQVDTSFYIASSDDAFDLGGVQYVKDAEGALTADTAVPDNSPNSTIDGEGGGGGPEDGEGGGGGEGDTGSGGGQDTGGGGQDTGGGGGGG